MTFLKEGKTNWKYILIILFLAAIVGGGILWWVEKQEVPLVELPEIKKPEKVEDETANWKTYSNEEYGFKIKYPKDWGKEVKKIDDPKILHLIAFNPPPPSFTSFSVRVDLFPLEEILETFGGEVKEKIINQRKGYEITFPAEPAMKFWIFPYKGKNYSPSCLSPYDPNICDQIINTLIIE